MPEGAIFLRDIRHHDDHRPLNPQSLEQNAASLTAAIAVSSPESAQSPQIPLGLFRRPDR